METQTPYVQLDATPADIVLVDLNKSHPYICTAFDESGRCLAIKIYESPLPQNKIDFLNGVRIVPFIKAVE